METGATSEARATRPFFLSVDPVVADYADPQSYNAYSYARNNPVSYTDPTGMCSVPGCWWTEWIDTGNHPDFYFSGVAGIQLLLPMPSKR